MANEEIARLREEITQRDEVIMRLNHLAMLGFLYGAILHEMRNGIESLDSSVRQLSFMIDNDHDVPLEEIGLRIEEIRSCMDGIRRMFREASFYGDDRKLIWFHEIPATINKLRPLLSRYADEIGNDAIIEYTVDFDETFELRVTERELSQIILNLVLFTLKRKFETIPSAINVNVLGRHDSAHISMWDDGKPLNAKMIDDSTQEDLATLFPKSGVEMMVVEHIIQQWGGKLKFHKRNDGSTRIEVPL